MTIYPPFGGEPIRYMREGRRLDVHHAAVRHARHLFGEAPSGAPMATTVTERLHKPPPRERVIV